MYAFILKTYQRFLNFLKRPDDRNVSRVGLSFKLSTFFSLLLLNVVFSCLWILGFRLVGVEGLENLNSGLMNLPFGTLILIGVVLAPFLEELVFRFPMKYSRNYLLQFLIALVALVAPETSKKAIYTNVRAFWKRYFWVFFYLMTSLFAFVHIYNFVDAKQLLLWSPLLTLAQFVTGLIIGYIRVRFGFIWGWYYHAIYNLLFFTLAFTTGDFPKEMDFDTFIQKHTIKTDTLTIGNNELETFQFESAEYKLSIKKADAKTAVFTGYYGVTPSHIYFKQSKVEMIMRILTHDNLTVIDPDSLRFDIEMTVKHPAKNPAQIREILIRELTTQLSLK